MEYSLATIGLAAAIALLSASLAWAYVRRSSSEPLALAQVDLLGHLLASGGLLSLLPEGMKIFAPELVGAQSIVGTIWERLDYMTFVLVSVAVGMNVMRRILQVRMISRTARPAVA